VVEADVVKPQAMTARRRALLCLLGGVVVAVVLGFWTRKWDIGGLGGWDVAGLTFIVWTWRAVWWLDQVDSARKAEFEDPTHGVADLILLGAAVASLGGVALVLLSGQSKGSSFAPNLILAVASVVISWAVVHTVYALRYARLYYGGVDGGINFHSTKAPVYKDFAYLSFTVGMTFQVSDTEINDREIRANILRHALLSYLFGSVILASTINLLAGLSK
jgi:uncharacterized membrane protein